MTISPQDRPGWMPRGEIAGETMKEYTYEAHQKAVLDLCRRTGIRAQIDVLEEAAKAVCYGCRNSEPTVQIAGSTYHLTGHTEARESCNSWSINERISALRKELGA